MGFTLLSDPIAERDALILMTSALYSGCMPLAKHLPEKNRTLMKMALHRAFVVLGIDLNDEQKANEKISALLAETMARRTPIGA